VAFWLSERIQEIERFTGKLPSIAILVNDEACVLPLAEELNATLEPQNLRVVGCPNGQVVGQDSNVRVFNANHIKGLEFEAVFFVGIDELAHSQPELFDKFLYVGATRAATYLGLTCSGPELPPRIRSIGRLFASSWQ
jgi:DNA helicase IV